jgi:hypothetical protein
MLTIIVTQRLLWMCYNLTLTDLLRAGWGCGFGKNELGQAFPQFHLVEEADQPVGMSRIYLGNLYNRNCRRYFVVWT